MGLAYKETTLEAMYFLLGMMADGQAKYLSDQIYPFTEADRSLMVQNIGSGYSMGDSYGPNFSYLDA